MSSADRNNDQDVAREVFARHEEIKARGHDDFCKRARKCENYYLGGGRQWTDEARAQLEMEGRPAYEINDIMRAVNSVGGYQIANRMDIAYLPRGGGTDELLAKVFSKYAKHCLDNTGYRDHETDVFMDGLIQGRGFIDMRMDYQTNTKGEIKIVSLDSMDVGIDPDAQGYDPDTWSDVEIARWLTLHQAEMLYGKDIKASLKEHARHCGFSDTRDYGIDLERSRFGDDNNAWGADLSFYGNGLSYRIDKGLLRFQVIERQSFEFKHTLIAEYPTGDIRILEGVSREQIQAAIASGAFVTKRRIQRVRQQTCAPDTVIFNDVLPVEHFSVIPFFPFFRRGRTSGLVDNAISPQDMTNKFLSQYAAIINSTANGGWDVEEDQLINMTPEELEDRGSATGLILVRKAGSPPIKRIEAPQAPVGIEKMIQMGANGIERATGVNESVVGEGAGDMSGVAIQSRQFAAQQQYAIPLWRLSQTRRMVAVRLQKLIQRYMIDERVVRITETDEYGVEQQRPLPVNQVQEDGSVLNDLTAGEYDIAVTEQPMRVTFDDTAFEQIKSMRQDMGVNIPDSVVIKNSTLQDKTEIAEQIKKAQAEVASDPVAESVAAKNMAQAKAAEEQANLNRANAVTKNTEALFSAGRVAQMVAADPSIADLADAIYLSAGGIDADAAPVVPTPAFNPAAVPPPVSTNPLTPDNPQVGADVGLSSLAPVAAPPPPREIPR